MWPELFNIETFWFWTLIVVQSGLVIWFVSQDQAGPAVLSVLSLIAGIGFFHGQWDNIGLGSLQRLGFAAFVQTYYGGILAAIGSYLILGLGWATFRWWLYVRQIRLTYERRRDEWLHPRALLNTASFFRAQATVATSGETQQRYSHWAAVCAEAAARGGRTLTPDLKPVWKEFVAHGYRF